MKATWNRRSSGISKTGTAMTPLFWMCGVSETIFIGGGVYHSELWFRIGCFIIAVLMTFFYAFIYWHFAKNDPDRLQTEEYNLDSQEQQLLQNIDTRKVKFLTQGSQNSNDFLSTDRE